MYAALYPINFDRYTIALHTPYEVLNIRMQILDTAVLDPNRQNRELARLLRYSEVGERAAGCGAEVGRGVHAGGGEVPGERRVGECVEVGDEVVG